VAHRGLDGGRLAQLPGAEDAAQPLNLHWQGAAPGRLDHAASLARVSRAAASGVGAAISSASAVRVVRVRERHERRGEELAEQAAQPVRLRAAAPHRVVVRPRQHPDRRHRLAVRRQRAVACRSVRSTFASTSASPGSDFAPETAIAVPLAVNRLRIDREHPVPGGAQRGDEQPTIGLHPDLRPGGGEKRASQTIGFEVEGKAYEIDLCDKHAKQFRDAMAGFVTAGRRASGRGSSRRSSARSGGGRQRTQEIRAWAKKKGLTVSERGRLSADVVAQWEAEDGH
jgi:hypothetical protein